MFTADFLDSAPRIRALLDGGATVLLDRWLPSAVAYQSALGFAQARSIARMLPLPKPALTLLLDLPASEAVRRKLTNPDRFDSSERLLAKQQRRASSSRRGSSLRSSSDLFTLATVCKKLDQNAPIHHGRCFIP